MSHLIKKPRCLQNQLLSSLVLKELKYLDNYKPFTGEIKTSNRRFLVAKLSLPYKISGFIGYKTTRNLKKTSGCFEHKVQFGVSYGFLLT